MKKSHYLPQADLIRAVAIIAVVAVHVSAVPVTSLSPDSSLYLIYLTMNNFGKLGVPTFIFLSGFMLFYSYSGKTDRKGWLAAFFRNKFDYIVLPYLAWSLFYHLYSFALRGVIGFNITAFLRQLLLGNSSYHLYFMVIIIQFYLFFPFIFSLIKNKKMSPRHLFLLSLSAQWLYYFFNKYGWQFVYKSRVSLSYFSFFAFGILLAANYDKLAGLIIKRRTLSLAFAAWAAAIMWNTVLFYNAYTKQNLAHSVWFETAWNAYAFLSFIFLSLLAVYATEKYHGLPVKAASILGRVSFGVYLLHPALLSLLRKIPPSPAPLVYHFHIALEFFVALTASCLIIYLLQKHFPFTDYLFGKSKVRA